MWSPPFAVSRCSRRRPPCAGAPGAAVGTGGGAAFIPVMAAWMPARRRYASRSAAGAPGGGRRRRCERERLPGGPAALEREHAAAVRRGRCGRRGERLARDEHEVARRRPRRASPSAPSFSARRALGARDPPRRAGRERPEVEDADRPGLVEHAPGERERRDGGRLARRLPRSGRQGEADEAERGGGGEAGEHEAPGPPAGVATADGSARPDRTRSSFSAPTKQPTAMTVTATATMYGPELAGRREQLPEVEVAEVARVVERREPGPPLELCPDDLPDDDPEHGHEPVELARGHRHEGRAGAVARDDEAGAEQEAAGDHRHEERAAGRVVGERLEVGEPERRRRARRRAWR